MRAFIVAGLFAASAFWLARGVGIPVWRDWDAGDASDIALCVFLGFLMLQWGRP
jgi:hypothetical protein